MHRFVRILLATSCLGVMLGIPASAGASDPRTFIGGEGTQFLPGGTTPDSYCAFDVLISFTSNEYIIHQSTAPDGTVTVKFTGNATATATNLQTGKSITYKINGPGTEVFYPNGAVKSGNLEGPNLLWTTRGNSYSGVPYLSYTTGHVTFSVDASGVTTAYSLSGRQIDVCQALAG